MSRSTYYRHSISFTLMICKCFFMKFLKIIIYIVSRDLRNSIYSICIVYYILLSLECRDDNKQLERELKQLSRGNHGSYIRLKKGKKHFDWEITTEMRMSLKVWDISCSEGGRIGERGSKVRIKHICGGGRKGKTKRQKLQTEETAPDSLCFKV